MTVVINDFEVVAEVSEARAPEVPGPVGRPTPPVAAVEIQRVTRELAERALRVWAG